MYFVSGPFLAYYQEHGPWSLDPPFWAITTGSRHLRLLLNSVSPAFNFRREIGYGRVCQCCLIGETVRRSERPPTCQPGGFYS